MLLSLWQRLFSKVTNRISTEIKKRANARFFIITINLLKYLVFEMHNTTNRLAFVHKLERMVNFA